MGQRTVGLALGSGGARGFAHIGVLRALEEHHVPVHMVAGSSMGSLVGAFYVTGMRPAFMEKLALTLKWRHWADFTIPRAGLIAGSRIRQVVHLLTRGKAIQEADIPFAVVATDLISRNTVVFREGSIADAVRASVSIPGVFVPYPYAGGLYVDGGVTERVPVGAVRALGADVVISVDVGMISRGVVPENIMDVIMVSLDIMQEQTVLGKTGSADVQVIPDVSHIGTSQFHKAREAIQLGYDATIQVMDQIQACLMPENRESSFS